MKYETATPSIEANDEGTERPRTALHGLLDALPTSGWNTLPDDDSMGELDRIEFSEEQSQRVEQTGIVVFRRT